MRLWSQIFSNKAAVPFFFVFTPRATVPCGSRPAGVRRFLVSPRIGRAAPAAPTGSWCWCPRPQTRHPDPGWPRGAATLRKSPFLLRCRRPSPGGTRPSPSQERGRLTRAGAFGCSARDTNRWGVPPRPRHAAARGPRARVGSARARVGSARSARISVVTLLHVGARGRALPPTPGLAFWMCLMESRSCRRIICTQLRYNTKVDFIQVIRVCKVSFIFCIPLSLLKGECVFLWEE